MRKRLLAACLLGVIIANVPIAMAAQQEYADGWRYALDSNPKNYSPQSLAGDARKIPESPTSYRIAIETEDDTWYLYHDNNDRAYNYMMFSFTNTEPSQAWCNWRMAVESWADVYLYY